MISEAKAVPLKLEPMEARLASEIPTDKGWQYEPKWDGFRALIYKRGKDVTLISKSGKPLGRYFPEVVAMFEKAPGGDFVLDGELVIDIEGSLSFEALQARLHPAASRIKKLSSETPAIYTAFDCLESGGALIDQPFEARRNKLEMLFSKWSRIKNLVLTPGTTDTKTASAWLKGRQASVDGIIAKRLDQVYRPGERAMIKVKLIRTADCVVGGFRYESKSKFVGSLLLGLFDDEGLLHHVGFTSALSSADKPEITKLLKTIAGPPGFTGDAPGGPSRWSTKRSTQWEPLKPKLVVEVSYDHVTGGRFRHGTNIVRWRPDKKPSQCTFDQIALPASPLQLAGV